MKPTKTDHFIRSFITWFFRARPPEVLVFKYAVFGLVGIFGLDWIGEFLIKFGQVEFGANIKPGTFVPEDILRLIIYLLLGIMSVSALLGTVRFSREHRSEMRKKVIVIEGRGLRDDDGNSLASVIPRSIKGKRLVYLLDLRQRQDGRIIAPDTLIPHVSAMRMAINQQKADTSRDDITVVYGGLTAVPFTFLTGSELDDESRVIAFDWDRTAEKWRQLDEDDDKKRFEVKGLDKIEKASDVLLTISVSYPVDQVDIDTSFALPRVHMELEGRSNKAHWSQSKQSELADQFFELAKELAARGVRHIHLIMAAPNSVCFNFGRRYDRRNLPDITIYQFEKAETFTYPWGVFVPGGGGKAKVVQTLSKIGS